MRDRYKHGDHNVICDRTGFKVKASETRKEWNGLRVWKNVWEPRDPQDLIKGRTDKQAVYDPRPEGTDSFISLPYDIRITEEGDTRVTLNGFSRRLEDG